MEVLSLAEFHSEMSGMNEQLEQSRTNCSNASFQGKKGLHHPAFDLVLERFKALKLNTEDWKLPSGLWGAIL